MRSDHPTSEKFWSRVDIKSDSECWNWTGPLIQSGYGQGRLRDMHTSAHRIAWIDTYGDIPDNLDVAHKCANKLCCNPKHLYLSTHSENMREIQERNDSYLCPQYHSEYGIMPCGHSSQYIVSSHEGTHFCLMCEYIELAKFREDIKAVYEKYV